MNTNQTISYHRTAVVYREIGGGYDVRGGGYGGRWEEFLVTETTNHPDVMLECERRLIRLVKVTTTMEVVS